MIDIRKGDCRELLREMLAGSVRCCVTSPPYWGLRDYGTATWEGGDEACEHNVLLWQGPKQTQGAQSGHSSKANRLDRTECECGARRIDSQLGLEKTPEEYVARLVEVFREVRRVLADDGTLWLNLGDSYASGGRGGGMEGEAGAKQRSNFGALLGPKKAPDGLKPKDLVGIPWRVAFALQADGWYLRSEIIWAKPNPMPESVTDRPTKAHEYLFLLAKSQRYYYDAAAIAEPCSDDMQRRAALGHTRGANGKVDASRCDSDTLRGEHAKAIDVSNGRNRRTVWTVPTQPFSGAHFAVMPEALVEPCILAGSAPGDTVLDPFAGSGTVGVVALRHGRRFIGCELNAEYARMAQRRISGPLFADVN